MKKNINLSDFTKEELIALNHLIKERFEYLQQAESYKALSKFKVGDRVYFDTMEGRRVKGTITRLNKKSVSLTEDNNKMNWKVGPVLLRRLHPSDKPSNDSNVVSLHIS